MNMLLILKNIHVHTEYTLTSRDPGAVQERKLHDLFRRADLDGTGDVNRSEFRACLGRFHFAERDADVLFDRYVNTWNVVFSYIEYGHAGTPTSCSIGTSMENDHIFLQGCF